MSIQKVSYINVQAGVHKQLKTCSKIAVNLLFSFVVALASIQLKIAINLRVVAVLYAILSATYTMWELPKYVYFLRWAHQCESEEEARVKHLQPGSVDIDGFVWDVRYDDVKDIVVDCEAGVAHIPFIM